MLPNYDYDTENAALEQKLRIAQAMQQGALQDPSQGLAPGVRLSPLAPIAKIVQAMMASKKVQSITDQQRQLGNRYKADAQAGLRDFIEGISAAPGQTDPGVQVHGTTAPGQGSAPMGNNPSAFVPPTQLTADDVKRKKIEAVANAMGSGNPILQQLAMSQVGQIGKGDEMAYHVVGGKLVAAPKNRLGPGTEVFNGEDQWGPLENLGADTTGKPIFGQRNKANGQIKFAPAGTNVNVNTADTADTAAAKAMGPAVVKTIETSYEKTKDLPQKIATLESVEGLLNDGMRSGALTDPTMMFMQLGEKFGLPADPATANTQTFRGQMANGVLDIIKQLKPASDADQQYAKQAAGADPNLSAQAIRNLVMSAKAAAMNQLVEHNKMLQRSSSLPMIQNFQVPFKVTMDPGQYNADSSTGIFTPKFPQSGASAAGQGGGPIPLSEYLKQKGMR